MNFKKRLVAMMCLIEATCFAGTSKYTPATLRSIQSSQISGTVVDYQTGISVNANYGFSNWKTGMKCTIMDQNRVIDIRADIGPIVKVYDSSTVTPSQINGKNISYHGGWYTTRTYTDENVQNTVPVYTNPPNSYYTTVTTNYSNGAYLFNINTSNGLHNIALFPSGFYVSQNNNGLYTPGC